MPDNQSREISNETHEFLVEIKEHYDTKRTDFFEMIENMRASGVKTLTLNDETYEIKNLSPEKALRVGMLLGIAHFGEFPFKL